MKKLFDKKHLFVLLFSMTGTSLAEDYLNLKVIKVYDGDTIRVEAPFLPDPLSKMSVRLFGIDTPEKGHRAKCSLEREKAELAKLHLESVIKGQEMISVRNYRWDKYGGRILGDVIIDGVSASTSMIESKLAVPYFGKGKKNDWCGK